MDKIANALRKRKDGAIFAQSKVVSKHKGLGTVHAKDEEHAKNVLPNLNRKSKSPIMNGSKKKTKTEHGKFLDPATSFKLGQIDIRTLSKQLEQLPPDLASLPAKKRKALTLQSLKSRSKTKLNLERH